VYKKLDVEQDISEQGFVEHSYDVIVASNVLHATQSLEATLKNTRRLLKPGGSLIILEITSVLDSCSAVLLIGGLVVTMAVSIRQRSRKIAGMNFSNLLVSPALILRCRLEIT
jgi:ubiquinone/menaquinone biosynthesis C-methylase UbiE